MRNYISFYNFSSPVFGYHYKELAQVKAAKGNVLDTASQDKIAFHNEHSGKINDQAQKDLQQQAAKEGLDSNLMKANIQNTQNNLGTKGNNMKQNAEGQIDAVERNNTAIEQGMDKKVQEYEKDRTSKKLGIGGMDAQEKAKEYLKGGEKAVQIPPEKSLKPKGEK